MTAATHVTHGLRHRPGCSNPDRLREFTGHLGDHMIGCVTCGAAMPIYGIRDHRERPVDELESVAPESPPPAGPAPRCYLECVRCETPIPTYSTRPRIPLCSRCTRSRARRRKENHQ